MKIAVDCDEVLAEFVSSFAAFHNEHYGTSLRREDFHTFDFKEIIGITDKEEDKRFSEFYTSAYFFGMQPIHGSAETLGKLKKRGMSLSLVTARPLEILEATRIWADSHFKDIFSSILFSSDIYRNNSGTKAQICKEIGAEIMIDDSPKYSMEVSMNGTRVLLYDAPWNRNHQQENVTRVNSWKDIERIILT